MREMGGVSLWRTSTLGSKATLLLAPFIVVFALPSTWGAWGASHTCPMSYVPYDVSLLGNWCLKVCLPTGNSTLLLLQLSQQLSHTCFTRMLSSQFHFVL